MRNYLGKIFSLLLLILLFVMPIAQAEEANTKDNIIIYSVANAVIENENGQIQITDNILLPVIVQPQEDGTSKYSIKYIIEVANDEITEYKIEELIIEPADIESSEIWSFDSSEITQELRNEFLYNNELVQGDIYGFLDANNEFIVPAVVGGNLVTVSISEYNSLEQEDEAVEEDVSAVEEENTDNMEVEEDKTIAIPIEKIFLHTYAVFLLAILLISVISFRKGITELKNTLSDNTKNITETIKSVASKLGNLEEDIKRIELKTKENSEKLEKLSKNEKTKEKTNEIITEPKEKHKYFLLFEKQELDDAKIVINGNGQTKKIDLYICDDMEERVEVESNFERINKAKWKINRLDVFYEEIDFPGSENDSREYIVDTKPILIKEDNSYNVESKGKISLN